MLAYSLWRMKRGWQKDKRNVKILQSRLALGSEVGGAPRELVAYCVRGMAVETTVGDFIQQLSE